VSCQFHTQAGQFMYSEFYTVLVKAAFYIWEKQNSEVFSYYSE